MLRFLYHISQVLLTLFWVVCLLIFMAAFAGIGFAGGMLNWMLGGCPGHQI